MPDNELQIVTTLDPSGIRAGAEQSSDAVKKSTSEMKQGFAESGNASKEAADKMNYSMTEARHSIMELGAETRVHMPRAVASFVASIGPVGSLLAAAFPLIAVIALIDVFVKAAEKIKEFQHAAELSAAAWSDIDRAFTDTDRTIQQGIDQQETRIIAYTKGPLAAMEYAFQHMETVAIGVFKEINREMEGLGKELEGENHWYKFWDDAGEVAEKQKEAVRAFKIAENEAAKTNSFGTTIDKAKELKKTFDDMASETKKPWWANADDYVKPEDMVPKYSGNDLENINLAAKYWGNVATQLERSKTGQKDRDDSHEKELALKQADEKRQFDAQVISDDKALAVKRAELHKQAAEDLFQRGQITNEQLLSAETTFNNAKYKADKDALEAQKSLVDGQQGLDPEVKKTKLKALNDQLKQLDIQYQTDKQRIEQQGFNRSVQEIVKAEQEQAAATKGGTQARVQVIEAAQAQLRAIGAQGTQAYKALEKEKTATLTEEETKRRKFQDETTKEVAKDEIVLAKTTHDEQTSLLNQDKTELESKFAQQLISARSYYNQLNLLAQRKKDIDDTLITAEYNAQKAALDKEEKDAQGDVDRLALILAKKKTLYDQYIGKLKVDDDTLAQTIQNNRKKELENWKKHLDQMNQEFETTINGMIDGSKTFGQSMDDMFTKMVQNFADKLLKMFLNWAENLIMMSVLKETTDKSDHAKSIIIDAKDAAAKAFAAGMKAPWPLNMVIAPVLAAAAFTGTMAFAEKGALVPDDMLMNVHKDEMVLPAKIANPLQSALSGGAFGGNGGTHFHGSPITIQAIDGPSVQRMLDEHGTRFADHSVKSLERAYKNGRFR